MKSCVMLCECVCRTQVVIEVVEEHQHAAAHDHEHTNHDGGDIHRLLVLLLCAVIPLVLHVASAGGETTMRILSLKYRTLKIKSASLFDKLEQGFILYVKIDGYSPAVGARMIILSSTVNIYHHLTGWPANTCFLSDFRTYHSSKMFSARGPVSHRPHLTVPSVTLATPSGRADLDLLRPVSHSYGLK